MLRFFVKRLLLDIEAKYLLMDIGLLIKKTELGSLAALAYP